MNIIEKNVPTKSIIQSDFTHSVDARLNNTAVQKEKVQL